MKLRKSKSNFIPAYIALAEKLRSAIASNNFLPGDFIGTEVELSKDNSITRMTVRRAIQILIDEGLLERQPGKGIFVKNPKEDFKQIKLLSYNLSWMPSIYIGQGMKLQAEKVGSDVILCDYRGNEKEYIEAIRDLPNSKDRNCAVIVSIHNKAFYNALLRLELANYRYVVVDEILNEFPSPSIASDNLLGGKLAVQNLLECGHTNIGFIGDVQASTTEKRFRGGAIVLAEKALTYSHVISLSTDDSIWEQDVLHNLRKLMNSNSLPTAFFCSCDAVARYVYRAASILGLSIPDDISVVGYDDDPIAEWLSPALSTIRQPFEKIGEEAVNALIHFEPNTLDNDIPVAKELPVEYIQRDSVKRMKKERIA
jgi:LacI family transcriptional regulator